MFKFPADCFTRPLQTVEPRPDLSPSDARLFSGMLVTDPEIKLLIYKWSDVVTYTPYKLYAIYSNWILPYKLYAMPYIVTGFYLGNIDLSSVHKLKDSCQVLKWDIFQNDDRVLGWVFLE